MTLPPIPSAPTPAIEKMIRTAIESTMTTAIIPQVKEMVDRASSNQASWHNQRMKSVEDNLRQAGADYKKSRDEFREAAKLFNETMALVNGKLGSLETSRTDHDRRIQESAANIIRLDDRLTLLEQGAGRLQIEFISLKADIFGSPETPGIPSIMSMITAGQNDIMVKLRELVKQNDDLALQVESTNKTVQEHAQFITRLKFVQHFIAVQARNFFSNKRVQAVIITIILFYLGSLPGIEVIQRLVEIVRLIGK